MHKDCDGQKHMHFLICLWSCKVLRPSEEKHTAHVASEKENEFDTSAFK